MQTNRLEREKKGNEKREGEEVKKRQANMLVEQEGLSLSLNRLE